MIDIRDEQRMVIRPSREALLYVHKQLCLNLNHNLRLSLSLHLCVSLNSSNLYVSLSLHICVSLSLCILLSYCLYFVNKNNIRLCIKIYVPSNSTSSMLKSMGCAWPLNQPSPVRTNGDYSTRPDMWIFHVICPYTRVLCSCSLNSISLSINNRVASSSGPHYKKQKRNYELPNFL